ncbi:MAG: hypothetical protein K9N34_04950 [Candidatus Marinimicrobia bacterium]|nr:hypothetical protein [Candidatus Neomarinimicrobiota bacterium]MCF7839914.1 hypothetical protein [Candidatus Neomarinimicrobiota bacterium]
MMDCARYRYWLENQTVLERDDERELERHLTVCPACRQVSHAMLRYEAGVLALRRRTHSVTDEGAVDKIMGAVKMTSRLRPRGSSLQMEPVMNVLTEPVIRYVTGALIVLILALFVFQEAYTQHQLTELAHRLEIRSGDVRQPNGYLSELLRWRRQGMGHISRPLITEQAFNQFMTHADMDRIPLIWRFRYGKNYPQPYENFWRQLMR